LSYQYYDVVKDTRFPLFTVGFANDIALKYVLQRSSVSAPIYPQSGSNFTFTAKATLPYSKFGEEQDYASIATIIWNIINSNLRVNGIYLYLLTKN